MDPLSEEIFQSFENILKDFIFGVGPFEEQQLRSDLLKKKNY